MDALSPNVDHFNSFHPHTQKKSAVNTMADDLEIQIFSFRAGWQARNFHSAFDYIFNNKKKDAVCGKVLAGWPKQPYGSNNTVAYAPNAESIVTRKEKFQIFARELFNGVRGLNLEIKLFLTATIFRWYDEFNRDVEDDPKKMG